MMEQESMVSRPRDGFVLALVVVGGQLGWETRLIHPFSIALSTRTGSDQTLPLRVRRSVGASDHDRITRHAKSITGTSRKTRRSLPVEEGTAWFPRIGGVGPQMVRAACMNDTNE